jgi:hypothetical protein
MRFGWLSRMERRLRYARRISGEKKTLVDLVGIEPTTAH